MTIRQDQDLELRQTSADEVDVYAHWMTHGKWRQYDAPWESQRDDWEPEALVAFREKFFRNAIRADVWRVTLYLDQEPIGWMNSYRADEASVYVGINICEDAHWGKGIGTRAVRLWVDYWFRDRKRHRVNLDTWSFNPAMMRVAEKCGFVLEGVQREAYYWDGAWRDMHMYGILEHEYIRVDRKT